MRALTERSSAPPMESEEARAFVCHESRRLCNVVQSWGSNLLGATRRFTDDFQTLWQEVANDKADPMVFHTHVCAILLGPSALVDYVSALHETEQAVLDQLRSPADQLRTSGETAPEDASFDQLPGTYGKFGLVPTNPVPCSAAPGGVLSYLLSLRKDGSGLGLQITVGQVGTTMCRELTRHAVVEYRASPFSISGGSSKSHIPVSLFLVPKFSFNSPIPPTGFHYFDLSTESVRGTVCLHCGSIIPALLAYMEGCPECENGHGTTEMDNLRWRCSLTAFSNRHWTPNEMQSNAYSIKTTGKPIAAAQQVLGQYLGESQQAERRAKFLRPLPRIHL